MTARLRAAAAATVLRPVRRRLATADPADLLPPGLPACAVVDLDAIAANVAALGARAGAAGVMAVVKADGYGHGLVPAARAALAGGAAWLGVAQLAEALALRAAGVTAPVLAWLTVPGRRASRTPSRAGVDIGVSARLGRSTRSSRRPARPAARPGSTSRSTPGWPAAAPPRPTARTCSTPRCRAEAEGAVRLVGIWSHFACADAPEHPTVRAQTEALPRRRRARRAPRGPARGAPPRQLRGDR